MTTLSTPITVDATRWPDVARVPRDLRARMSAGVARGLFRRAVGRLPISVRMDDGSLCGGAAGVPGAPVMLVHNERSLMRRIGRSGLIGFGESYLAGEWDSDDLAELIAAFASGVDGLVPDQFKRLRSAYMARQPRTDLPSTENSRTNVERHYDLSNDMFALFLDESMTYSSALFEPKALAQNAIAAGDLVPAQHHKIDRMLDAARVGPGTRLLEIGTGWGELALRAAKRGAFVHSVTLSKEQLDWAQRKVNAAGLADQVTIELKDYRDIHGSFDAVVSVEMIEAVGLQFLHTYFSTIRGVLAPGGRAVIQAITMPHHRVIETRGGYTWIHKYIFPGGALPSVEILNDTTAEVGLQLRDDLAMGSSYTETLRLWAEEFSSHTTQLEQLGFDEVFRRMWTFYLRYSEGGFRSGYLDVHQLTFEVAA